jgi:hypothetical protein
MIEKTISTEHGDVTSTAEVLYTDNGQVLLHITSKLANAKHEHRVTVGAEDGKDHVADLPADALQTLLQQHLDEKRDEAAQILNGRVKVSKVAALLQ